MCLASTRQQTESRRKREEIQELAKKVKT